jgi:hypothetical protein
MTDLGAGEITSNTAVVSLNGAGETAAATAAHVIFPPVEVWAGMTFGQRKNWRKIHLKGEAKETKSFGKAD